MKKYLSFVLASFFLFSCINEEGEGGISVVQGHIYQVLHEDEIFSFEADTFPAAKTDVYIVYGDEPIYGDKMETGHDGYYRFKYLTDGTYKVFAYSTFPDSRKVAVIDSITVAKGETKTVNNIYIHEGKSLETSYIKGRVLATYYNKGFAITAPTPAYGVRVYIRLVGSLYQFDEVRTGLDGVFMFQKLEPGEYEVFTLTEDRITEALSPVIQKVTISEKGIIKTIDAPFQIIITT